jgi:putative endonuclease
MIRCIDSSLYTGITNDLYRRMHQHNSGKGCKYTSSRTPVSLIWYAKVANKSTALRLEYNIKLLTRKQKLQFIGLLNP